MLYLFNGLCLSILLTVSVVLVSNSVPTSEPTTVREYSETVPTNRSDVTGNTVAEMVTWGTSAVFVELELTASENLNVLLYVHV